MARPPSEVRRLAGFSLAPRWPPVAPSHLLRTPPMGGRDFPLLAPQHGRTSAPRGHHAPRRLRASRRTARGPTMSRCPIHAIEPTFFQLQSKQSLNPKISGKEDKTKREMVCFLSGSERNFEKFGFTSETFKSVKVYLYETKTSAPTSDNLL